MISDNINNNTSPLVLGNSLFISGEYHKALDQYLSALSITPSLYFHYENIGLCYERLNDEVNAQTYYMQALALNPNATRAKSFLQNRISTTSIETINPVLSIESATENNKESFSEIHIAASKVNKDKLKKEYSKLQLNHVKDTFVLARIIGNDLFPRHALGQSRENLEFILKNEQPLDHCKKIWIVNRIFNKNEFNSIIRLLEKYEQEYHVIPFIEEEYKQIKLDYTCLPSQNFFETKEFKNLSTGNKQRMFLAMLRLKNNYIMNNNGARNFALSVGKKDAKWVLPWDGNCFVNNASWQAITSKAITEPYLKHIIVPMARITSNDLLLDDDYVPEAVEEPQIIFRSDTNDNFNESYCYGRRPKVELFWRLGIPGVWDKFKDDQWDQPRLPLSSEANAFGIAGWTSRLFSGMKEQELYSKQATSSRNEARQLAIYSAIREIDEKISNRQDGNTYCHYLDGIFDI